MVSKFAVIGLGQFGRSIARTLARRGAEVLAIDNDPDHVDDLKDEVAYAVVLDATDQKALKAQNIEDMDAVVVAIGEDFEALLLTTVMLLDLKVKRIIARAANAQQRRILEKMGIEEILSPEDEVAKTVAENLLNPSVGAFLQLPDNYEIVEIDVPRKAANKPVREIQLREKYNLNLITVKRAYEEEVNGEVRIVEHIIGIPTPDTNLYESDTIIILGKVPDVEKFTSMNK